MKTLTFLAAFLITFSSSFSQKVEIKGYVFDKETGNPIRYAGIHSFSNEITVTDENGYFHFSSKQRVDTIQVYHIKYKNVKIAVDNADILKVELNKFRFYLGSIKLSDSEYLNESEYNPNETKIKNESLVHDVARFKGGLLCLDKYIWTGLVKYELLESIKNANKISILFEVTETGVVNNVKVKSKTKLNSETVNKIERIFLDSPEWIPAWQYKDKVSVDYSYNLEK